MAGVSSIREFGLYSLIATILGMVAYFIADHWLPEPFRPNRWIMLAAVILLGAYFIFVTVPAAPLAAVILPVLLLVILLSLHRNRQSGTEPYSEAEASPPPLANYLDPAGHPDRRGRVLCAGHQAGLALADQLGAVSDHHPGRFRVIGFERVEDLAKKGRD